MRTLLLSITLLTAACSAVAQNPAPVQGDTQTHVTSQQKATASTEAGKAAEAQKQDAGAPEGRPTVLDSVVAIVNGDVVLQSDVEEERRFESLQLLPPGENNDVRAAEHLFTRTLILQQMKAQEQDSPNVTEADVNKFLDRLKKQLPGCQNRCQTGPGWAGYLAERGMTPQEVAMRWRQRLIILDYLNMRFRSGVRVPEGDVHAYYDKNLVPQFQARHEKPPSLESLQPRIEEILLQQQVSKQITDWETTLRQEGSIRILVPAYGQSNSHAQDPNDTPGGAA